MVHPTLLLAFPSARSLVEPLYPVWEKRLGPSGMALEKAQPPAWREGLGREAAEPVSAVATLLQLRQALANDLDTPVMLATLDAALDQGVDDPGLIADAALALLGVHLRDADVS